MKRKLIQNLSVNAFQLILNQLCGLIIFYILSTGLDKNNFGQINLALAILLAAFNILSFGIDQISIKKIAAGENPSTILSLYISHVLLTGFIFYALLFLATLLFHHTNQLYNLLLLIGIGKLMIYFSTPFKQAANGLERFRLLAYLSVISNIARCCGLIGVALSHSLNLHTIVIVFIAGDFAELTIGRYLFARSTNIPLSVKWNLVKYKELLRESLPQTGVVLITSALARFDWIFIGFILSSVKLAEYSFAYKIFEVSTLPLLAVAPLLIPRFTKLFQHGGTRSNDLVFFVRIEMIGSVFVALVLNLCWAPVIDTITAGKYGAVNVTTIFILSLCMPLLYLNNFLWTIYFAQGRLKMILSSFILTFSVNVGGDLLLIPFFKNEGAAFAFLAACAAQTVYYLKKNELPQLNKVWYPLAVCVVNGLISGFAARSLFQNTWFTVPAAAVFYVFMLIITGQIRLQDQKKLIQLLNW
jgi:O-antigen/teichoic acid export membrane protein